jgi:hypothetical protein
MRHGRIGDRSQCLSTAAAANRAIRSRRSIAFRGLRDLADPRAGRRRPVAARRARRPAPLVARPPSDRLLLGMYGVARARHRRGHRDHPQFGDVQPPADRRHGRTGPSTRWTAPGDVPLPAPTGAGGIVDGTGRVGSAGRHSPGTEGLVACADLHAPRWRHHVRGDHRADAPRRRRDGRPRPRSPSWPCLTNISCATPARSHRSPRSGTAGFRTGRCQRVGQQKMYADLQGRGGMRLVAIEQPFPLAGRDRAAEATLERLEASRTGRSERTRLHKDRATLSR